MALFAFKRMASTGSVRSGLTDSQPSQLESQLNDGDGDGDGKEETPIRRRHDIDNDLIKKGELDDDEDVGWHAKYGLKI
jgi:hypothetical protein